MSMRIGRNRLRVHRKGYKRKGGVHVPPSTFYIKDRGAVGRTRMGQRWFEAEGKLDGWGKNLPSEERHAVIKRTAERQGYLRTYNKLLGLANVTADKETEQVARADYRWMSREYADQLSTARKRAR